uniref:Glycylpeptide N-tetradecanoyltransferase n=1 Tax=Pundamilia nyererei TaxID=303518 RepID=A0A3B4G2S0_9CICH
EYRGIYGNFRALKMSFSDEKLPDDKNSSFKKSKKKKKGDDAWRPQGPRDPFAMLDALPENKQQEIQRALHLFSLEPGLPKTLQQAKKHTYCFWDTQPVPKLGDSITTHGPIVEGEASIRKEPYSLPQGFSWDTLDLSSPPVLRELCSLLNENYMEEDDNTTRFDFSLEYLQWALQPPNWVAHWHCGVRVDANRKLVGFIAAVPADRRVVQVKFLCVHKKLRLKRMTPVLIRELARRVNQQGLCQAVYTTGIVLPTPISSCRLWHRPLNPRKLMEVNHPALRQSMNLQRALKFNRLPEVTKVQGLRPMTREDIPGIHSLLQTNFCKFHLKEKKGDNGALTDIVSFYSFSSRVLNHPVHTSLRGARLLYVVSTRTKLVDLMEDTLVLAKSKGCDVFSAIDVMDNKSFLEKLKFSVIDQSVHYYLYNWMCPNMTFLGGFLCRANSQQRSQR